VTGLSGAAGSEVFYMIEVPAGQDELEISISGGTGDCDLYVRRNSPPTTVNYDYRPYKVGNEETVSVESPAAGTWYIMLRGYSAYSGVTLEATYSAATSIVALDNGVPVSGLSAATGEELYFSIDVPAGQSKLEINISGGSGDCDLYVKRGKLPTISDYDYRPFLFGNDETVSVNDPDSGTWYIMLRSYDSFSGVTLLASYGGGVGTLLSNGVPVTGISGAQGSEKVYRIEVPAGQTNLEIMTSGGTPDVDLYVKYGSRPTISDYDYRPFLAGNDETVNVNGPTPGTWYIMLQGYSAYSGVTLRASFGDILTLEDEVPVTDLSGALGSEKFFKIEVPSGQDSLLFRTYGGTGNVDMYIKRGSKPTTSNWDYRPYQPGNEESLSIGQPEGGTWFVMLKARQAYAGVSLEADYSFTGTVKLLSNGVPVPNISGAEGSEQYYRIIVPGGQKLLEIKIFGGTGDADLYVSRDQVPTVSQYDYRPYLIGNDETVTINDPAGGNWLIMIRGYKAFTGVTLVATFSDDGGGGGGEVTPLDNGVPVTGLSGAAESETFFKIDVPPGQHFLEVATFGGTGDCDLYVRTGFQPTVSNFDGFSGLKGNDELVEVIDPAPGVWYIMLRATEAYSGVTLVATYGAIGAGNDFTTDPNCVALWRFEQGELPADSIGTNTLANDGVQTSDADFQEGAAAAVFDGGEGQWLSIDDPDLSTGFPTKNGDTDVEMSICFWMKPESFAFENTIISKYLIATDDRSWRIYLSNRGLTTGTLNVGLGTGSGGSFDTYKFDEQQQVLNLNHWYHVAFTYRDSDKQYHVRVWDHTAGALLFDVVGTAVWPIAVNDAPVFLGTLPIEGRYFDGLLDEMVVFKDVLTSQEIDQIRQGSYGGGKP
jgi:hypothetical protein